MRRARLVSKRERRSHAHSGLQLVHRLRGSGPSGGARGTSRLRPRGSARDRFPSLRCADRLCRQRRRRLQVDRRRSDVGRQEWRTRDDPDLRRFRERKRDDRPGGRRTAGQRHDQVSRDAVLVEDLRRRRRMVRDRSDERERDLRGVCLPEHVQERRRGKQLDRGPSLLPVGRELHCPVRALRIESERAVCGYEGSGEVDGRRAHLDLSGREPLLERHADGRHRRLLHEPRHALRRDGQLERDGGVRDSSQHERRSDVDECDRGSPESLPDRHQLRPAERTEVSGSRSPDTAVRTSSRRRTPGSRGSIGRRTFPTSPSSRLRSIRSTPTGSTSAPTWASIARSMAGRHGWR